MALASPCRRRGAGIRRRVHFNEMAQCVLFQRGPGFDTLPADGGVALALDDFVSFHYEPLSVNVDEPRGMATPRRHPTRRREEQLAKMPPGEREALLVQHAADEAVRACLRENQSIMRTHAEQSKFCACVSGCDTAASCPCASEGIGCHHEGAGGCRCRKGCRNPGGLARYDVVQLRRDRKRALAEYTRREGVETVSSSQGSAPSTCPSSPSTPVRKPRAPATPQRSSGRSERAVLVAAVEHVDRSAAAVNVPTSSPAPASAPAPAPAAITLSAPALSSPAPSPPCISTPPSPRAVTAPSTTCLPRISQATLVDVSEAGENAEDEIASANKRDAVAVVTAVPSPRRSARHSSFSTWI